MGTTDPELTGGGGCATESGHHAGAVVTFSMWGDFVALIAPAR